MGTILDQFRLDGRIAIVTGASRGLGASFAVALAEAGADVALVARGDLKATAEAVARTGRRSVSISVDVGATDAAVTIIKETTHALGTANILVNNAGLIRRNSFLEFSETDWSDVMAVNLEGPFRLSQHFARPLVAAKQPGKIINVASLLSFQGGIRVASYTAAKSGLNGLTKLMANELAAQGINVNALAPGYIATDNTAALRDDPDRNAAILARIPAGRWGEPEDLNGALVFLASAASNYMHGFTLTVDGGWLAR